MMLKFALSALTANSFSRSAGGNQNVLYTFTLTFAI